MRKLRLLLVDDHVLLSLGLEVLLDQLGHKIVGVVQTAEEAIRAAERERPDLIVMDIELEGPVDGIEAAKLIRERFGINSVFFSGYTDPDTRARAMAARPVAFLDKASPKSELLAVIKSIADERPTGPSL